MAYFLLPHESSCARCGSSLDAREMNHMEKIQSQIKVRNLAVVQFGGVDQPRWYVATADGTLIFGPFSSLEEAMEAATGASSPGSASKKEP